MTLYSLLAHPRKLRRKLLARAPGVVHAGRRGTLYKVDLNGLEQIEKRFTSDSHGNASFAREAEACDLFGNAPWKVPVSVVSHRKIVMPCIPYGARLDRISSALSSEQRFIIAVQALDAALEIHTAGYAHRDFSTRNLFLFGGRLLVSDFETLTEYPVEGRPPFAESYDVTGQGLVSPHRTGNMGYASSSPASLQSVLGVSSDGALNGLRTLLKTEIYNACRDFQAKRTRHQLKKQRIYCAFETPHLIVTREEAQRSAPLRFARFGIKPADLCGRSVLDLGCNTGAMLFQAAQYEPARALGLEYDTEKVRVARRVAAFAGLNQLEFRSVDLDAQSGKVLNEHFDVVFCLAIEAHVKFPERLYRLLGDVTKETLYFEGNSSTDRHTVARELKKVGFMRVEYLGECDDDLRPQNNRRPLLVARRS